MEYGRSLPRDRNPRCRLCKEDEKRKTYEYEVEESGEGKRMPFLSLSLSCGKNPSSFSLLSPPTSSLISLSRSRIARRIAIWRKGVPPFLSVDLLPSRQNSYRSPKERQSESENKVQSRRNQPDTDTESNTQGRQPGNSTEIPESIEGRLKSHLKSKEKKTTEKRRDLYPFRLLTTPSRLSLSLSSYCYLHPYSLKIPSYLVTRLFCIEIHVALFFLQLCFEDFDMYWTIGISASCEMRKVV